MAKRRGWVIVYRYGETGGEPSSDVVIGTEKEARQYWADQYNHLFPPDKEGEAMTPEDLDTDDMVISAVNVTTVRDHAREGTRGVRRHLRRKKDKFRGKVL